MTFYNMFDPCYSHAIVAIPSQLCWARSSVFPEAEAMPAIDLTKLDKQITDQASSFDNPAEFRVKLHDLLSYYHLYARKPSKEKLPKEISCATMKSPTR